MSFAEANERIRELDTRRSQLERQNERLCRAEQEATASCHLFADLFDAAPISYALLDAEGCLQKVNRAAARLLGEPPGALLGRPFVGFLDESDRVAYLDHLDRCTSTGPVECIELPLRNGGEAVSYVEIRTSRVEDPQRRPSGYRLSIVDVTERRRQIDSLRESEAQYSRLVEQAHDGVAIVQDAAIAFANQACADILGYPREQLIGMPLTALVTAEHRELVLGRYRRRVAGDDPPSPYVVRLGCRDGTVRQVELAAGQITHKGRPATMGILRDVSDRKRAEEALRRESNRTREYLDVAGVMIIAIGPDGRVSLVNRKGCEVLGYSEEEIVGADWFQNFLPARVRAKLKQVFCQLISGEMEPRLDWYVNPVLTKDGEERLILWHNAILRDEKGRVTGTLGSGEDITERKQAEDAVRKSERKYKELVEGTLQGILVIRDSRVLFANRAAGEVFHMAPDALVSLTPDEVRALFPPGDWLEQIQGCAQCRADQEVVVANAQPRFYHLHRPDGSRLWIDAVISVVRFDDRPAVQIAFVDQTRRKAVEEQLRRTESQLAHAARLTAMGELVTAIVHEVNQPLFAIRNFAKATRNVLAADDGLDREELSQWNEEILSAAASACEILQRQRAFTRRTESGHERLALNEIVGEAVRLVDCDARRHRIALRSDLGATPELVQADRIQIQQVMVNLLRNAIDSLRAVPEQSRCVTIRSETVGEMVRVSVADNGVGLPADGDKTIFEPFVSTKEDGLGIGLAISRTIVETHGGTLWAEAASEGGAIFHFTLPAVTGEPIHVA